MTRAEIEALLSVTDNRLTEEHLLALRENVIASAGRLLIPDAVVADALLCAASRGLTLTLPAFLEAAKIVAELAAIEDPYWNSDCRFCDGEDEFAHMDECLWERARAWAGGGK